MPERQMAKVVLRPATMDDCEHVWQWRNDPENRPFFFNPDSIDYEQHVDWYSEAIKAADSPIFITLDEHENPVGYVRFNITEDQADISVALDNIQKGKGYGAASIKRGSDLLLDSKVVTSVMAQVKNDNPA